MRSKSLSCFFCGGPGRIKTAQNAKKPVKLDDNNVEIINMWEEKCVVSTCRMLKIPTTHPAVTALLEETQKYCDECMQTMRDLEFTVGAMDKLQRSIRKLRRILLDKLEWKYETMEKPIGKESSSLTAEGEPFDLFGFVFQKAKDALNEDASVPASVEISKPTKQSSDDDKTRLERTDKIIKKEHEVLEDSEGSDYLITTEDFTDHFDDVDEKTSLQFPQSPFSPEISPRLKRTRNDDKKKSNKIGQDDSGGENEGDEDFALNSDHENEDSDSNFNSDSENENEDKEWKNEKSEVQRKKRTTMKIEKERKRTSSGTISRRKEQQQKLSIPCPYSDDCDLMFSTHNALDKHIKNRHGDRSERFYSCDLCEDKKTFMLMHNLKIHKSNIHKKKSAASNAGDPCSFCGVLQKPEELADHENLHRSREFPFSCLTCEDAKFPGAPALSRHMKHSHPQSSWKQCHHCGNWFKSACILNLHIIQVHEFVPGTHSKCSHCSKVYKSETSLKNHEKICFRAPHNKDKDICEVCGKICKTKYALKKHMVSHEEATPFKCKVCDKSFKRKTGLVSHEAIHAGLKYPCPDCSMVFSKPIYLRYHSKRHLDLPPRKDEERMCPDGDKCTKKHDLIHTGFPFKCKKCIKTFRLRDSLRAHSRGHLTPEELMRWKMEKSNKKKKRDKKSKESKYYSSSSSSSESLDMEIQGSVNPLQNSEAYPAINPSTSSVEPIHHSEQQVDNMNIMSFTF